MIDRSPLWPASPPPDLTFSDRDREIELVVDDDDLLGLHAVAAGEQPDGLARVVHVRERDRERDALPLDAHLVDPRPLLALLQLGAVPLREQLHDLRTDVVARPRVLLTGIAETDDEQVGRGSGPRRT